jgi:hypothetical protein
VYGPSLDICGVLSLSGHFQSKEIAPLLGKLFFFFKKKKTKKTGVKI